MFVHKKKVIFVTIYPRDEVNIVLVASRSGRIKKKNANISAQSFYEYYVRSFFSRKDLIYRPLSITMLTTIPIDCVAYGAIKYFMCKDKNKRKYQQHLPIIALKVLHANAPCEPIAYFCSHNKREKSKELNRRYKNCISNLIAW